MSDRRPPQRPTSSTRYGARPTGYRSSGAQSSGYRSSGARPTGSRPAGYGASGSRPSGARPAGGSRRTPPRRGKRPNGRFYVFLGILLVVIVAVVLLIWRPWASGGDPSVSAFVAPTPVVRRRYRRSCHGAQRAGRAAGAGRRRAGADRLAPE